MENFNPTYIIIFEDICEDGYKSEIKLNLKIEHIKSNENNKEKYDLTYEWAVLSGNDNIHQNLANPFLNMPNYDSTDLEGVIIINNKLSTELIKHLVMSDKELSKICGNGTASDYKKRILNSLSLFWD